jgi:hypothetical protein
MQDSGPATCCTTSKNERRAEGCELKWRELALRSVASKREMTSMIWSSQRLKKRVGRRCHTWPASAPVNHLCSGMGGFMIMRLVCPRGSRMPGRQVDTTAIRVELRGPRYIRTPSRLCRFDTSVSGGRYGSGFDHYMTQHNGFSFHIAANDKQRV